METGKKKRKKKKKERKKEDECREKQYKRERLVTTISVHLLLPVETHDPDRGDRVQLSLSLLDVRKNAALGQICAGMKCHSHRRKKKKKKKKEEERGER